MRAQLVVRERLLGLAMPDQQRSAQTTEHDYTEWELTEEEIWEMGSLRNAASAQNSKKTAQRAAMESSKLYNNLLPRSSSNTALTTLKYAAMSAPVDVPIADYSIAAEVAMEAAGRREAARSLNIVVTRKVERNGYGADDDDIEQDDEKPGVNPPHVITARQHGAMAASVMEGAGRTLKGRDLRNVRNAVWKQTGFFG